MSTIHKIAFRVHETIVWDTPADPPDLPDLPDPGDPAEVVSLSAAQTLPSHAPGVRMTVVINILPQITKIIGVRAGARTGYVIPGRDGNGGWRFEEILPPSPPPSSPSTPKVGFG